MWSTNWLVCIILQCIYIDKHDISTVLTLFLGTLMWYIIYTDINNEYLIKHFGYKDDGSIQYIQYIPITYWTNLWCVVQ
jgi:hypothetical protein